MHLSKRLAKYSVASKLKFPVAFKCLHAFAEIILLVVVVLIDWMTKFLTYGQII